MDLVGLTPFRSKSIEVYQFCALSHSFGVEVEGFNCETSLYEIACHWQTHIAQTNETNFLKVN